MGKRSIKCDVRTNFKMFAPKGCKKSPIFYTIEELYFYMNKKVNYGKYQKLCAIEDINPVHRNDTANLVNYLNGKTENTSAFIIDITKKKSSPELLTPIPGIARTSRSKSPPGNKFRDILANSTKRSRTQRRSKSPIRKSPLRRRKSYSPPRDEFRRMEEELTTIPLNIYNGQLPPRTNAYDPMEPTSSPPRQLFDQQDYHRQNNSWKTYDQQRPYEEYKSPQPLFQQPETKTRYELSN